MRLRLSGAQHHEMEMYNATVEVARKVDRGDDAVIDAAMDQLQHHHPALGGSPRGWHSATISLPAESLAQAFAAAVALVEGAYDAPAISAEVMTAEEFDARQGWAPIPELVSVAEAAEVLGVSRQRVLQRIEAGTLPAKQVGKAWVIARTALEPAG